jgi:hypothetical protein
MEGDVMQAGKQISRLALAAIIATAVVAPTAGAAPVYGGQSYDVNRTTGEYMPATAAQDDVTAPVGSDLRSEGAKSPIVSRVDKPAVVGSDMRGESAKGPGISTPPPGLPTWPLNPTPIVPAAPQPVAATDTGDGSFDWPLAGLIAGGVIALAGAALVARHQLRGHIPAH